MKKKQKLMYRLISLLVLLCTAVMLLSTSRLRRCDRCDRRQQHNC